MSTVAKIGREYGWLTGSAAFVVGVTSKYRSQNSGWYPFNAYGMTDFVAQVFGRDVAKAMNPSWNGGASQTFNPGAAINKYTVAALILYLAADIDGLPFKRVVKTARDVLVPILAGYGLGKAFDDPPYSQTITSGAYPTLPAHVYGGGSNTGRSLMVAPTRPWNA